MYCCWYICWGYPKGCCGCICWYICIFLWYSTCLLKAFFLYFLNLDWVEKSEEHLESYIDEQQEEEEELEDFLDFLSTFFWASMILMCFSAILAASASVFPSFW